ncbi:NeuD/PglB/VioB family sugar acetyltransferase [Halomonas sp. TRM85114]|uniref:NeuD/PglB/VioB family sugar acetyltransferase n=1 Tax=Halomonas jincaotanensis TaxID=2810616 RepID=UPI001BD5738D|nr:NeuD/PglB/VioB family sugar acetyltransferase [Halomonas jincaotanensis]MBS9404032.1 NeuD/PglB/VioB family sugar acetyltransferase [Halomonas jincaotanensis]
MSDFIIVGGGGHARVVHDALETLGHRVTGYTDPDAKGHAKAPYLGTDAVLIGAPRSPVRDLVLGIGKVSTSPGRLGLLERLELSGYRFPVIHARGSIVHQEVMSGIGTVTMDGAVVVTGTRLGRACIVNTNATVDHDCRLGDNVHVATGAILCGGVSVGDNGMIGAGATLVHGVRVCADCVIGAGATVVRDIDQPGIYVGTPARRIK